jgi:hypothetical protein
LVREQVLSRARLQTPFLVKIVHLSKVGRQEKIRLRAFVDLPGQAAGRAEIEFHRMFGF